MKSHHNIFHLQPNTCLVLDAVAMVKGLQGTIYYQLFQVWMFVESYAFMFTLSIMRLPGHHSIELADLCQRQLNDRKDSLPDKLTTIRKPKLDISAK